MRAPESARLGEGHDLTAFGTQASSMVGDVRTILFRVNEMLEEAAMKQLNEGWRVGEYATLVSLLDEGLHVLTRDLLRSLVARGVR